MTVNIRRIVAAMAVGACAIASLGAGAQGYPQKPIKIVIAFGPGAGVDVAGRILADALTQQMKQSVFVENREGAGGIIGSVAVAKSPPDGYTLLFASEPLTTSQLLTSPAPYDPVKDFVPVAKITTNPLLLVASVNAPYKTWKELVAYAKANPGKVSYATSGKGSSSHLETELLKARLGLDITDIPYKTFGPALADTQADRVGFFMSGYGALLPHVKAGTVRALAIGGKKRSELLPDVPTFAEEFGVPDYEAKVWYGVLAPAGTPPDVVARIHAEIVKALDNPAVRERYRTSGAEVAILDPVQFTALVKTDTEKWSRAVNTIGFKALQ
jgi:tripartite-type tricarboxylate transporter receptor subunit TctC